MTLFKKGYADDIGIDICLDYDVTFAPFETKAINIGPMTTRTGIAAMMCSRSSAAIKGIIVNQAPIDPGYNGDCHIIAHNCSNENVRFSAGQAFAQIYFFKVADSPISYEIKKRGKRNKSNFGGTDNGDTN